MTDYRFDIFKAFEQPETKKLRAVAHALYDKDRDEHEKVEKLVLEVAGEDEFLQRVARTILLDGEAFVVRADRIILDPEEITVVPNPFLKMGAVYDFKPKEGSALGPTSFDKGSLAHLFARVHPYDHRGFPRFERQASFEKPWLLRLLKPIMLAKLLKELSYCSLKHGENDDDGSRARRRSGG
jgi:hypothetical protein